MGTIKKVKRAETPETNQIFRINRSSAEGASELRSAESEIMRRTLRKSKVTHALVSLSS